MVSTWQARQSHHPYPGIRNRGGQEITMQNKDVCNLEWVLPALPGAVLYLLSTDLSFPGQNSNGKHVLDVENVHGNCCLPLHT